jgi:hypothetical protein
MDNEQKKENEEILTKIRDEIDAIVKFYQCEAILAISFNGTNLFAKTKGLTLELINDMMNGLVDFMKQVIVEQSSIPIPTDVTIGQLLKMIASQTGRSEEDILSEVSKKSGVPIEILRTLDFNTPFEAILKKAKEKETLIN